MTVSSWEELLGDSLAALDFYDWGDQGGFLSDLINSCFSQEESRNAHESMAKAFFKVLLIPLLGFLTGTSRAVC